MSSGPSAFSSSHGGPSPRKLTLVLPPLSKASAAPTSAKSGRTPVKTQNSAKKKKGGKIPVERGPPRPPKPKPLKEVLTRLINQAQKCVKYNFAWMMADVEWLGRKDAYGFFLNPVDPAQVPGYADVIRRPMDFSTMASKVSKGKYRSLQEFAVCPLPYPPFFISLGYFYLGGLTTRNRECKDIQSSGNYLSYRS